MKEQPLNPPINAIATSRWHHISIRTYKRLESCRSKPKRDGLSSAHMNMKQGVIHSVILCLTTPRMLSQCLVYEKVSLATRRRVPFRNEQQTRG
jgi:hypothetical protein